MLKQIFLKNSFSIPARCLAVICEMTESKSMPNNSPTQDGPTNENPIWLH